MALAKDSPERREVFTLLTSIFCIAGCGLIYELLIATVSSYLLGSSVTQFSISIGVFIGSMGLGSHLSQRVESHLLSIFILTEIVLGLVGGASVALLFLFYSSGIVYWIVLYGCLIVIGALVGLELPLLTRVLKRYGSLRTVIAQALSFDYVGALAGSLLFPLLLLPSLGMMRTAFSVGVVNIVIAAWNLRVFGRRLYWGKSLKLISLAVGAVLAGGFIASLKLHSLLEGRLYRDPVVYAAQTPYQRIVLTRWRDDLRLFLDGNLQFCSLDEYRYHEALVHPAMSLPPVVENVLILGGGDGLAAREILKYSAVKSVTLVDIDPRMTDLARTYPDIIALNQGSLRDSRVKIVHQDAHKFLEQGTALFDVVISDLPDPNSEVLAKLYSEEFYRLVRRRLAAAGVFAAQASSPYFSRDAFWCIVKTVRAAGLQATPYHAYVPSFGDWGFVLAAHWPVLEQRTSPSQSAPEISRTHLGSTEHRPITVRAETKFLTPELLREIFVFAKDVSEVPVDASTLDRPAILNYYLHNARKWEP